MDTQFFITTIIGVTASALTIWSFQRQKTQQIFFIQIFSTCLWVIHFILMGALSGVLMNAANMVKAIALVFLPKQYIKIFVCTYLPTIWIFFIGFIYTEATDFFPVIAGTIGAFIMFFRDNRYIVARASIIGAACWIAYALIVGSFPALVTDSFILMSIVLGMIRHEEKPFKFFRIHP